jgi:hypothetical protein
LSPAAEHRHRSGVGTRRAAGAARATLRWARPGSFAVLLAVLLVVYVVSSLGPLLAIDQRVAVLAIGALLVTSVYVVSVDRRMLYIGAALVAAVLALRIVPGNDHTDVAAAHHALAAVFLAWVVGVTVREIFIRERALDPEAVLGAVCGYLLLVFLFAQLYELVVLFEPRAFTGIEGAQDPIRMASTLVYFSTVTLSTVGYGEISPVGALARMLAGLEALIGPVYLATIIAALVGLRQLRRQRDEGSHD